MKKLINKFGSLAEVISAPINLLEDLEEISGNTAISLKSIDACAVKLSSEKIMGKPILANWQQVSYYTPFEAQTML